MIRFGDRKEISTIVISTALGYDGRGIFPYTTHRDYGDMIRTANATGTTRISKSMTRHKRSGNFHLRRPWTWKYIQKLGEDGMLNAYGLTNKGVEKHSREIARSIADGIQLIPNFFPGFSDGAGPATKEILEAIVILQEKISWTGEFWAIELSYSCPNAKECNITGIIRDALRCTEQVKKNYPNLIVIVKISVAHPPIFARQLRDAGADVLHISNSVPYNLIFSNKSPLWKVGGGGVSGGPAFEIALNYAEKTVSMFDGPIILGCGIVDDEKLEGYFKLVADKKMPLNPTDGFSYSVCTAALQNSAWVESKIIAHNHYKIYEG
ncbi:MAG: hypothetical protein WC726_02285 [Parcubacteria group bacterium]